MQLAPSEARCYRQRAGIEGRHVAEHRGLAGNEAADRLADAGRRRGWFRSGTAALTSCTPSFHPESEVPFLTLADRIFWQGIKDEVDPLRPWVIKFCVCHGSDSTRDQAEIQAWWRRSAALIRSACLVSSPLVRC